MKFVSIRHAALALLSLGTSLAFGADNAEGLTRAGSIMNSAYKKCLDFPPGNTSNYIQLQLWSCAGPDALNQRWIFFPAGQYSHGNGSYLFMNVMNQTCAAVEDDSMADGAKIVQRECDSSNPSQHWIQTALDDLAQTRTRWINGRSGKCLDAWNSANGTVLQQYACARNSNWAPQGFRAVDVIQLGP